MFFNPHTPILLCLFQVRITLQSVDIEKSDRCAKDSLSFYDGETIGNVCGNFVTIGCGRLSIFWCYLVVVNLENLNFTCYFCDDLEKIEDWTETFTCASRNGGHQHKYKLLTQIKVRKQQNDLIS